MSAVDPIPQDRPYVVPYLTVDGAAEAIEFYKQAFGAVETMRMPAPDGRLLHAELTIGGGIVYLCDDFPEMNDGKRSSSQALGGSCVGMHFYAEDCDATFRQAVDAGATSEMEPEEMFWGDRFARVRDPFGHHWSIATHIRDADLEEMTAAMEQMFSGEAPA